ncbi:MAG TPA: sigma 54-interacting transcriptional regulator [Planctomycetota bacterium]|nr:sigma 54-interacting transcriptional regulator [Planctomycetota bacterium]
MKVIVVEEGGRTELRIDRPIVTIGRAVENDIRLSGSLISRHHCRIEEADGRVWIVDMDSSNGTTLDGVRIQRAAIGPDAQIGVGRAILSVEIDRPEPMHGGDTQAIDPSEALRMDIGQETLTGEGLRERENLRVFAGIARELVRETDLAKLLRSIVDSAVSLSRAERGFLLLAEAAVAGDARSTEPAAMKVRVARSFDREDIPIPASRLSMGIARRVVKSASALLSVDAGRDERFSGMASVEDLKLRSVMCVPIHPAQERGEPRVEGVLYVDNRLQHGAFSTGDLELMKLVADQASIAIFNARTLAELRERNEQLASSTRKIEHLNEQLGRKVRDRDTELAVVRAELGRERGRYDYTDIVGASEGMRRVFQQLDRIIPTDMSVLILGESGTGKELIARAIHFNGPRKAKPFLSENCAALPDTLLESELFGHARGAFTGAHKAKRGLLEQADGGTLFLDEIGDMSQQMQKKLLRVLQEGEFRSLGSDERLHVDVRIIAASHRDIEAMVRSGEFREDLFYRVNVLNVSLPPLRERREDIPLLADALLARAAREANGPVPLLPREVIGALAMHDWPGNVRELENEMRRIVVLTEDEVRLEHLSRSVLERRGASGVGANHAGLEPNANIRDAVADLERRSIEASLAEAGGNKSKAAAILGISRFALQRKLDKYGIQREREDDLEQEV